MYLKANGVRQSIEEAMKWYRRAADQGLAIAQFNLGFGYASGQGVPQDDVMAHKWFSLSAAQGNQDAARNRDTIEQIMSPEQIAEAQRLAREWKKKPERTGGRMDRDTFLNTLLKSKPEDQKRFFETLSSLTTREQRKQWLTSTPLWDHVAPLVIEAILDAITDRGLFEPFVLSSMEHDLVSKYEVVGQEESNKTLIRARISQILCQLGNKARVSLAETLKAKAAPDKAASDATLAEIAFESAIAMLKDQIVAYEGLSAIYGMSGDRAKCHDYAKRGLAELAETASLHPKMSGVIPPEAFDEMEQRLRQYLNC
jgi:hypothetical protein